MVVDCPNVITSIGDTLFQTNQIRPGMRTGQGSVLYIDDTESYLVGILKIVISTHFLCQIWRDNCCKKKNIGREPSRDGGSHGGKKYNIV